MTPTFFEFFKSFYYSNTYLPSVDLSEQGLSRYLLQNEDEKAATIARDLISQAHVKSVLSEPLMYDSAKKVATKNFILKQYGFRLLNREFDPQAKQRFRGVIEHDKLQGWIIKSGAARVRNVRFLMQDGAIPGNDRMEIAFFTAEDSLLRIEMANRIRRVAQEANIDVVIPKNKLVAYGDSIGITDPNKKYFVVCEKVDTLSAEETIRAIEGMNADSQKEIARKISIIVQRAGLVNTSFDDIRLTPQGKLAFIDTEPTGLMVAKRPGLWNRLFGAKGASVEKCARIGLFNLAKSQIEGKDFLAEVRTHYEKAVTPELSKWKIVLSILSVGLIPLIHAVAALVRMNLAKRVLEKIQAREKTFLELSASDQELLYKTHEESCARDLMLFSIYKDGTLHKLDDA